MHSVMHVALFAVLAVFALAAPTPTKSLQKRTFSIPVKPRIGANDRNGHRERARAFAKYGWEIILVTPQDPLASLLGGASPDSGLLSTSTSSVAPFSASSSSSSSPPAAGTSGSTSATGGSGSYNAASQASSSGGTTPASPYASSTKGSKKGEVTATPQTHQSEYLSPVSIGGQTLNLDFDTGSADFWVFSTDLPSSDIGQHHAFDASKSSTWSPLDGYSWQICYGDSSNASGVVGRDTVDIGGATVTGQAIELATAVSSSFVQDVANDGLVGLGFHSINTVKPTPQKTFFENVMSQLEQPVFTANLEEDASGTYEFGVIDPSRYTGALHFTPVDSSAGYWQFTSPTVTIGGTKFTCVTCNPAIADTGTSLLLMDPDIVAAYYSHVPGASNGTAGQQPGWTYPCSSALPDFGVAIGSDYTAILKGSEITYSQVDQTCYGGLQSNQGQGLQIIGDVLLKQFFAVFDGGNESFGLATKA